MTVDRIDARKHTLEADEKRNPDKDYSEEWARLASMYETVDGRYANYFYCLRQSKKHKESQDDGHHYPWQEWAEK